MCSITYQWYIGRTYARASTEHMAAEFPVNTTTNEHTQIIVLINVLINMLIAIFHLVFQSNLA